MIARIKHFFLPTRSNNFRAKLLHTDVLAVFLFISLFLNFAAQSNTKLANVLGFATDITVEKLFYYTNLERKKHNLPPLKLNEKLSLAAEMKAYDMFEKNYWAHYAPDGTTPWDFILKAGYEYEYAGENLAKNFMFSQDVVKTWMKSPTHRSNILKKEYTDVGFAVVNGVLNGEATTLVVQMFGKPLKKSTEENRSFIKKVTAETKTNNLPVKQKSLPEPKTSFDLTLVFLSLLSITLALDYYFAIKLKIIRNSSHNLITFVFLSTIIISLFLIAKGSIL